MENVLTTVERTLHEAGQTDSVRDVRLTFQQAMEDRFIATIEERTGRELKAFLSAVNVHEDTSVQVFTLEPQPDDARGALGNGSVDGAVQGGESADGALPAGDPA